jgi:hypothetical protein
VRSARRPAPAGVDVYLFPAVVGGGLGDVEEVLAAGRWLVRAGFRSVLYRRPGRPLPPGVEGPWLSFPGRLAGSLEPRCGAAMTVAPAWGVSAAPETDGPLGRAGPWAVEAQAIERAYGADRTVHVSLEEFARTLTPRAENLERLREGGIRHRELPARLRGARARGETATFDRSFLRFRAFDRPNVLHVFATFRRSAGFARAFPAAVQSGPLWPGIYGPRGPRATGRSREWVWYASPASAEEIGPRVAEGLAGVRPRVRLFVRAPRGWRSRLDPTRVRVVSAGIAEGTWRRRFAGAELRIVTGSRTLLEALELGGPFLYFNGVMGSGTGRRRHRPEKIRALLALGRERRWPADVLRDLGDFARARRIPEIVARAARRQGGWARFPRSLRPSGFRPPYDDAGALLVEVARTLGVPGASATAVVDRIRRRSNV